MGKYRTRNQPYASHRFYLFAASWDMFYQKPYMKTPTTYIQLTGAGSTIKMYLTIKNSLMAPFSFIFSLIQM